MNGKKAKAARREAAAVPAGTAALAAALEAMSPPPAPGPGRARVRETKRVIAEARTRRRMATYLGIDLDPSVSTADLAAQVSRKSAAQQRTRRA